MFPEAGEQWKGVQGVYVAATQPTTHYVDVSQTMDAAVESLKAHRAYLDGLGGDIFPDAVSRNDCNIESFHVRRSLFSLR